jgi:hypothetical protein
MNNNLKFNELKLSELDVNTINFGNIYSNNNTRILPIKSYDNNALYVTLFNFNNRSLITKYFIKYDFYKIFCYEIEQLNDFTNNMVNRLKYMINIPKYTEQKKFSIGINNKDIIIPQILQINNKILDLKINIFKNIINNTQYKIILRLKSICITDNNVYLNLHLFRIIPDSIDNLNISTQLYIHNNLNSQTYRNFENLRSLNNIVEKKYKTKQTIKDELYKLL